MQQNGVSCIKLVRYPTAGGDCNFLDHFKKAIINGSKLLPDLTLLTENSFSSCNISRQNMIQITDNLGSNKV